MILIESGNIQNKILINQTGLGSGLVFAYITPPIVCNTLSITNAGTASVNGTYIIAGTYNGYNLYTKDGNPNSYPRIRNHISSTYWEIVSSSPTPNAQLYQTTNMGSCPALLNWETFLGLPEPPTFSIIN